MIGKVINIAIITEGKAGHLGQSRGIAGLIEREKNIHIIKIDLEKGGYESFFRALTGLGCNIGLPSVDYLWIMAERYVSANDVKQLKLNPPNLVISTGTIPASFNVIISRKYKSPNVVSMFPSIIPLSAFTLAILPAHDSPANPAENVVSVATSPNECLPGMIAGDGVAFARENGLEETGAYWALFLGGESKARKFPIEQVLEIVRPILQAARERGKKCLVTTSRRTPMEFESNLKNLVMEYGENVPFLQIFRENPKSTTKGILALSEQVFITEDSVSMVSESLWAKRTTYLVQLPSQSRSKRDDKIDRFERNLANRKLIALIENKNSLDKVFGKNDFKPDWGSFDDIDKVRDAVNRIL